jgi:hypothetical protein
VRGDGCGRLFVGCDADGEERVVAVELGERAVGSAGFCLAGEASV